MGDILDVAGHKVAAIGDDLKVRSIKGVPVGHVAINGDVYDTMGVKVGYFTEDGKIYEAGRHIGTVHNDGSVTDYETHPVGKVVGSHIKLGGAALLLLVR